MPRVLMIDNYDSFTYNLVQYLAELGAEVTVWRNDQFELNKVGEFAPDLVMVSPGPSVPENAGLSIPLIERYRGEIPIVGVCLGHQAVAVASGAKVVRAGRIMHGKTSEVHHDGKGLFRGLPNPLTATRYHSLIVERESLPDNIEVCAETTEGEIMGIRIKDMPVAGVQFHPESILSPEGMDLLRNAIEGGVEVGG
ncbi:MAG: aminodeoxychorismate/anthranilate synthase component II [Nitrospinaceae bacterium]|jgi:para-aminobenzoate synthetase component II|nr:aminodeoxychorismate/anthranilate synthase component II [Nitrospinaceae bacterium]MBT4095097.1 aminodeoxychorismate/anthranilate synthase component II [Nitrospinaceae bacterium]MBT4429671.1 aminodeoxychorismate/anthranilate synthase component II [Nitrospinaceae bacterium]MBT5367716.1 aminodeoxychorismate/anthranilate synthase component II [Nitrospinaceae bacterium]MBT5946582.1 aminodeoxychorismate/anthranilate synthase component II [Nitrospinaceae bacterium]